MKLGIVFDNDAVLNAFNIIKYLNKKKYDVYPIYVGEDNEWYEYLGETKKSGEILAENIKSINNVFKYIKNMDLVLPLVTNSGNLIGLLNILNISYVGASALSNLICNDKVYLAKILRDIGVNLIPGVFIKYINGVFYQVNFDYSLKEVTVLDIDGILDYPVWLRDHIINNQDELNVSLYEEKQKNTNIYLEKYLAAEKIKCAVFNNQVVSKQKIDDNIKAIALKVYHAINANNLIKVSFLKVDNKLYLDKIIVVPDFSDLEILEGFDISYSELLDMVLEKGKK